MKPIEWTEICYFQSSLPMVISQITDNFVTHLKKIPVKFRIGCEVSGSH